MFISYRNANCILLHVYKENILPTVSQPILKYSVKIDNPKKSKQNLEQMCTRFCVVIVLNYTN